MASRRRRSGAGLVGLLAVVCAPACETRPPFGYACDDGHCRTQRDYEDIFQYALNRDLDLLLVVDDTPAIGPRWAALLDDLRGVAALLELDRPGGSLSLHVGVVPGSAPDAACAAAPFRGPACGVVGGDQFLSTAGCGLRPNFARPLDETLACMADLGVEGCGAFQPFAAVRRALTPGAGGVPLAGFLRDDATLMVVIIAGTDDAAAPAGSLAGVAEEVAALKSRKAYPEKVLVSVVGPPGECGAAAPSNAAPRLKAFVDAFGGNGVYWPLCSEPPIRPAFQRLFESIDEGRDACVPRPRDTDLATPGLQPDCTVLDRVSSVDSRPPQVLRDCDHAAPPCWRLTDTLHACPAGWLAFSVDRGPEWCPRDELNTVVTCLACVSAEDPGCAGP